MYIVSFHIAWFEIQLEHRTVDFQSFAKSVDVPLPNQSPFFISRGFEKKQLSYLWMANIQSCNLVRSSDIIATLEASRLTGRATEISLSREVLSRSIPTKCGVYGYFSSASDDSDAAAFHADGGGW